jgi:hypothetical protein
MAEEHINQEERVKNISADDFDGLIRKSAQYALEADYIQAIEFREKAINPLPPLWIMAGVYRINSRALTMLGICYYYKFKNDLIVDFLHKSLDCLEMASKKDDGIGYLWKACIYQIKNKYNEDYESKIKSEKHWWDPHYSPRLNAQYNTSENIQKNIDLAASFLFRQEDYYDYNSPEIVNFIFPDEVIHFLENKDMPSSKLILAFYYQSKGETLKKIEILEKLSNYYNNIIADYLLIKYYKNLRNYEEAKRILKKMESKEYQEDNIGGNNYYDQFQRAIKYLYLSLSKDEIKDINRIEHEKEFEEKNKQLEEKNIKLEEAQKRLKDLVQNTSHLAGNLLRPNTQEKIAKKLKNSEFSEESKKLYYASSDIKYVKQQFKLLEIMQSLTGSEAIISQIKLDQVDKSNNQAISIEDILNLAAFRAVDKLFDTNEYSLNFARETIEKQQGNFSNLSNEYHKYILETNNSDNLSIISWCSKKLRPISINYQCDDWKKILFYNNSQSVALFFCYFFELFFNAFKYADHNVHNFLTITLANEFIDDNEFLTMIWKNPKSDKTTSFGSNKGLNLSASYISLLNDDKYKDKSQELLTNSDNVFELITRVDRKIFNL